jgi:hypothetical protein
MTWEQSHCRQAFPALESDCSGIIQFGLKWALVSSVLLDQKETPSPTLSLSCRGVSSSLCAQEEWGGSWV